VDHDVDYIIVGAGAAGCVLANRLSADPGNRVLLLEAGGADDHPLIHMPKGISKVMADPSFIWPYTIEPEPGSNGVAESWARGRTLGGSSSINGLVYVRGQARDYDALASASSDDWNWAHMSAAYRAMENHELGASDTRGGAGPLRVSMPPPNALAAAVLEAGAALGLPVFKELNDPRDGPRIGYLPRTIHEGRRQSAAVAFLKPARSRGNLRVATGVTVNRVVFDSRRAVAVEALQEGAPVTLRARREILLCAGALATPAILQRSGIGSAAQLAALGIPCIQDAAEVGLNLREHRGIVMQWRVADEISQNRDYRGVRLLANTARYYLRHDGPMSGAAYEVGAWVKSREDLDRPDGQLLIAPFTFDYSSPNFAVEAAGGMNFCVYMLRPESTGSLRIRSRDPADLPSIRANYASDASDLGKMVDLIRYARRLAAQAPLADFVIEETRPGARYSSDEDILQAYRQFGYGCYHACGTCRMGSDPASVVDPRLRVRGVESLRVIDTSIFPFMLTGNTNAPAMATAWRAADLVLADRSCASRAAAARYERAVRS
jgi:choline dehydrogenase-like flavoprotein